MKCILFVLGLSWSCYSFSSVKITINETLYSYEGNPRLAEVLAPLALQKPWYWKSTALYRLQTDNVERLKTEVLYELSAMLRTREDEKTLVTLENQIREWHLADRVFIPIDYDLARVQPKFNPQFEDGEYILILKERPTRVSVFGMMDNPKKLQFQEGSTLEQYLSSIRKNEEADSSLVYIVENDGAIKKSGVAYWNNSHDQVLPGGQIFIPISESQFSDKTKILNLKIARLAANRVIK